jgi:hypothetical protein
VQEPFGAAEWSFRQLDGVSFGDGSCVCRVISCSAIPYRHCSVREDSPFSVNPFPMEKFRGLPTCMYSPEQAREFDERVGIDSFAGHVHNWMYVTPVEG